MTLLDRRRFLQALAASVARAGAALPMGFPAKGQHVIGFQISPADAWLMTARDIIWREHFTPLWMTMNSAPAMPPPFQLTYTPAALAAPPEEQDP